VVTTETGAVAGEPLDAIAHRLHRPVESLRACAVLSPEQQAVLLAALDAALANRKRDLDGALARLLPWPLRGPVLRWLRR
jgi:hypothetical protein